MAEPKKSASKDLETAVAIGACIGKGCKTKPTTFGFCPEHFDQFKFGLIRKTGELVPDHEKKLEHYLDFKAKRSQKRVA